jgi:hypothetical protein
MLAALAADTDGVTSRLLRLTACACCALVVLSFALFARDQMAGASQHQQTALVAGAASAASAPAKRHAQPRRFIDEAATALTKPFGAIVHSSNEWVDHGLPAVFALIVYGLGLGYLARYSRARA